MFEMTNFSHDAAQAELRYRDCIFVNGVVYTGGLNPSFEECLALRDGRIAYVGSLNGMPDELGTQEIIDLRGRMIVPGFTDSHAHPVEGFQLTCDAIWAAPIRWRRSSMRFANAQRRILIVVGSWLAMSCSLRWGRI
jgi:predicted amidohydrolase YtcJ